MRKWNNILVGTAVTSRRLIDIAGVLSWLGECVNSQPASELLTELDSFCNKVANWSLFDSHIFI